MDIAILVLEKKTQKKGILLIHGKNNAYYLFGAGREFGSGSDDFKWLDNWTLYKKKIAYATLFDKGDNIIGGKKVRLNQPAILLEDIEDGAAISGGIIYWDINHYIWIHQGE